MHHTTVFLSGTFRLPSSAEALVAHIASVRANVPESFRGSLSVSAQGDGDEDRCELSFTYERPETEVEQAARIDREARWLAHDEAAERHRLAQLLAKYGVPSDIATLARIDRATAQAEAA